MDELVRASIAMMYGAGSLMLAAGLLGAMRVGMTGGPDAATAACARSVRAVLLVLILAFGLQAAFQPDPTNLASVVGLLALRYAVGRMFCLHPSHPDLHVGRSAIVPCEVGDEVGGPARHVGSSKIGV